MEVQPNHKTNALNLPPLVRTEARRPAPATDEVNLEAAAAVDRALETTPEVRTEEVARARQLVGDPTYPPRETINRLSHLLAMSLPWKD